MGLNWTLIHFVVGMECSFGEGEEAGSQGMRVRIEMGHDRCRAEDCEFSILTHMGFDAIVIVQAPQSVGEV